MKTRILIIDENTEQLAGYKNALDSHSVEWEINCFETSEQALEHAGDNTVDIAIAAYQTNGKQGVALLSQIGELQPDAQRFILATEAEKPELEDAIDGTFQFLPSPCPADRLITEIQSCLAIDTWLGNPKIKEIVSRMGEFPSLPPLYLKVVNAINSRNASTAQIGEAISGDLAISAKILQTVNSSYYGFEEKIADIGQAVSVLGIESVKNLVLAMQVFGKLGHSADQKAIADQLWHHSMSVAVAAKRLALYETQDQRAGEEAYTAGLMHDIGKLVLLNAVGDEFEQARQKASQESIPVWQAENEIIGCNHAETGAYLLARWGMPAPLVEAVALHHDPANSFSKGFTTLAAVHLADALTWERQFPDKPEAKADPRFLADIGLTASWESWQAVVRGALTEKPKNNLGLKQEQPEEDSVQSRPTSQPTQKASSSEKTPSQTKESRSSFKFAFAAGIGIAAGVYFFVSRSPDAEPAKETEAKPEVAAFSEPSSPLARQIAAAKELFGQNRTEEALEEIAAAAEEAPEPPTALPEVEEPKAEEPETAKAEPVEVAAPPLASVEPSAQAPEPKTHHPKPNLPEQKEFFPAIELSGIFYSASNPLASVNGKIRRVGDRVAGAQIIKIEQRNIVVRYEDQTRSIKLN